MTRMTTRLRQYVSSGDVAWSVAAYDGLTAKLACEAGFQVISSSGFQIAASMGMPDAELYTMSENLSATRNVVSSSTVPVIADCDTGYGNAINVMRTVREFERIGVAGLLLEDQVCPKRCPAMAEPEILPIDEAVGKIRAAVAARTDPDLVIIGRTDALARPARRASPAPVWRASRLVGLRLQAWRSARRPFRWRYSRTPAPRQRSNW